MPDEMFAVDTRYLVAISLLLMEMTLHETAQITPRAETALAGQKDDEFVAPDELDAAAVLLTPPQLSRCPEALLRNEVRELAARGMRGSLGRSILARDLSISRIHLRQLQVLFSHSINKLGQGKGDEKRLRLLGDLVARQHRMMTTSAELLLRLDSVPTTSFQVRADAAAFLVSNNGGQPNMG